MRVLLSTLASAAFGQDVFLGRATSCKLAALAGNWAATGTDERISLNASITLNAKTCVLSSQFHVNYDQDDHRDFQLTITTPFNLMPDLFEAVGWRQSGDNAVQGFQASGSMPFSRDQFVGWLDPSTQSVTFYRYNAEADVRPYDFHSFWVRSGPAGRGAPAMDARRLATSRRSMGPMVGVAEPDPCEGKWPAGLLALLPGGGGRGVPVRTGFDVSSSAVTISPGFGESCLDSTTHRSYGIMADWKTCKVMGSITARTPREGQLPPKTLSANLTNFSIVALPALCAHDPQGGPGLRCDDPVAAVSMTVSTEHGDGSAVIWKAPFYGGYFMYCNYQDGSKEIFLWKYDDTY